MQAAVQSSELATFNEDIDAKTLHKHTEAWALRGFGNSHLDELL